jgi:hypothetical protein
MPSVPLDVRVDGKEKRNKGTSGGSVSQKADLNKNPYSWYLENTAHMFGCHHCGGKKTMANVDKDNNPLPGRLCMKCAEPVLVPIVFEDLDAPWKHSKGPWTAREDKDGNIAIHSEQKLIATVNVETVKQARFDAELMAASPELLFWLNRVVDIVHSGVGKEDLNNVIFKALEVVAKAEKWSR